MGKVLIAFDEETSKVLATKLNKSEFVREAVRVYIECISTDTLEGMRQAFLQVRRDHVETQERVVEMYEMVERLLKVIEDLGQR